MNHRVTALALLGIAISFGCDDEPDTAIDRLSIDLADAGEVADSGVPDGAVPDAVAGDLVSDPEPGVVGGTGGTGAEAGSVGGGPGVTNADSGGVVAPVDPDCRACVRLNVPANRMADYQLSFAQPQNLGATALVWRVRVRDFAGEVSVVPYAQSGDALGEEVTPGIVPLTVAGGWQDLALDLGAVEAFRAPGADAGAGSSAGLEGFPFDKTRVLRIGLAAMPTGLAGLRATLEIDAVTFSNVAGLNVDFSAGTGGFVLIDSPGVSATPVAP